MVDGKIEEGDRTFNACAQKRKWWQKGRTPKGIAGETWFLTLAPLSLIPLHPIAISYICLHIVADDAICCDHRPEKV
jgi:hypothetical protein